MAHGKIVVLGKIELMSPTLIGSGNGDFTDIDVLVDTDGKVFIPATALVGALRHCISPGNAHEEFWGFAKKTQGRQSMLRCSDLHPAEGDSKATISRRDGIKIDSQTGIVENTGKYDYQVVERGALFDLKLEVSYDEDDSQNLAEQMLATICSLLENEQVRIGAKSTNGLGKIRLREKQLFRFDFTKESDVLRWLQQDFSQADSFKAGMLSIQEKTFIIQAELDLKHSLIVRSYPSAPGEPDAVNVKSGNDYVLPGSSLKGAIRARAERIVNTLHKNTDICKKLFGEVDDKNNSKTALKGKVHVEETLMPKYLAELHHRVKIDRFTGGTVESALFDTMPVYHNLNDKVLKVTITIQDYDPHEAGLLLLVLKDLWTGDLAVGGEKSIGRGVFQGCRAEISWDDKTVCLKNEFSNVPKADRDDLEHFVKALQEEQSA